MKVLGEKPAISTAGHFLLTRDCDGIKKGSALPSPSFVTARPQGDKWDNARGIIISYGRFVAFLPFLKY